MMRRYGFHLQFNSQISADGQSFLILQKQHVLLKTKCGSTGGEHAYIIVIATDWKRGKPRHYGNTIGKYVRQDIHIEQ